MTYALGLMLVVVAGIFQAGFPLPMKYMKKWNWEISWSLYCIAGLFCLPWLAAYVRIPNLFEILRACTARELGVPIVYGMLWGVGLVFFGLGIASMGISLGNSIITGLGTPVGSLIPLIILHREKALEREGIYLFVGIFIMLFGVYYCGKARGNPRNGERRVGKDQWAPALRMGYRVLHSQRRSVSRGHPGLGLWHSGHGSGGPHGGGCDGCHLPDLATLHPRG